MHFLLECLAYLFDDFSNYKVTRKRHCETLSKLQICQKTGKKWNKASFNLLLM